MLESNDEDRVSPFLCLIINFVLDMSTVDDDDDDDDDDEATVVDVPDVVNDYLSALSASI